CGCQHEVICHSPDNIVAACRCDDPECPTIRLEPKDVLIHALDQRTFCRFISEACGFEPAPADARPFGGASRAWPVGRYLRTHSPVYFCACPTDELLLVNVEGLITAQREPFLLLVPTEMHRTAAAQSLLRRQHCELLPLSHCLTLTVKGGFQLT